LLSEGSQKLREAVFAGKMAQAAKLLTGTIVTWYAAKGFRVHPDLKRRYHEMVLQSGT